MTNKKGCCEDKHQVVKLEKKYNIPVTHVSATKIISLPAQFFTGQQLIIQPNEVITSSFSNSPPGKEKIPLFIRNCIYRI